MPDTIQTELSFHSKHREQRVLLIPGKVEYPNGVRVETEQEVVAEFEGGRFTEAMLDKLARQHGRDRAEVLDLLNQHPQLGVDFHKVEMAPPVPDATDTLKDIAAAAAALNVDGLNEILDAERDGHQRDVVLTVGEAALEQTQLQVESLAKANAEGAGAPQE